MRKRQELMGEHIKEELEKQICESKVSLNELLEHRDFHKLNHIFKEYYQVQLSPDFIGREDFVHIYSFYHPYLIGVEDEIFQAAMYYLTEYHISDVPCRFDVIGIEGTRIQLVKNAFCG